MNCEDDRILFYIMRIDQKIEASVELISLFCNEKMST